MHNIVVYTRSVSLLFQLNSFLTCMLEHGWVNSKIINLNFPSFIFFVTVNHTATVLFLRLYRIKCFGCKNLIAEKRVVILISGIRTDIKINKKCFHKIVTITTNNDEQVQYPQIATRKTHEQILYTTFLSYWRNNSKRWSRLFIVGEIFAKANFWRNETALPPWKY